MLVCHLFVVKPNANISYENHHQMAATNGSSTCVMSTTTWSRRRGGLPLDYTAALLVLSCCLYFIRRPTSEFRTFGEFRSNGMWTSGVLLPTTDTSRQLSTVGSRFTTGLRSRIFGCKSNRRETSTI